MARDLATAEAIQDSNDDPRGVRARPVRHANDVWVLPTARILEIVRGSAIDGPPARRLADAVPAVRPARHGAA